MCSVRPACECHDAGKPQCQEVNTRHSSTLQCFAANTLAVVANQLGSGVRFDTPNNSLSFWLTLASTASSRRSCSLCADAQAPAV